MRGVPQSLKPWVMSTMFAVLAVCCLLYSKTLTEGIVKGIKLSLTTVIPSLFSFMVLSAFLANTWLSAFLGKILAPIARKVFRLGGEEFVIFLFSLIGGYPVGAQWIAQKIERGEMTAQRGAFLLCFCVNCSPAFLISGVSIPLWNSLSLGALLYGIQVFCAFLLLLCFSRCHKNQTDTSSFSVRESMSLANALVVSVNTATKALGMICALLLLFCAGFACLELLPLPPFWMTLLEGLLEVTYGCTVAAKLPLWFSLLAVMLFTSFGGLCVHMQVMSFFSRTSVSFRGYWRMKVLHSLLSSSLLFLWLLLFPQSIACFQSSSGMVGQWYSVSPVSSCLLLFLGIFLLLFSRKSVRIKITIPNKRKRAS